MRYEWFCVCNINFEWPRSGYYMPHKLSEVILDLLMTFVIEILFLTKARHIASETNFTRKLSFLRKIHVGGVSPHGILGDFSV